MSISPTPLPEIQELLDQGRLLIHRAATDNQLSNLLLQDRVFCLEILDGKVITVVRFRHRPCAKGSEIIVHVSYEVAEMFRGRKRTKEIVRAAIYEHRHIMQDAGIHAYALEAIVDIENLASQNIASAVLSPTPMAITDSGTGRPSLYYLLKIDAGTNSK